MKNFILALVLFTFPYAAEARRVRYSTGQWVYEGASKGLKRGCGSRGGPGWRKPNGRCASWRDYEKYKHILEQQKR